MAQLNIRTLFLLSAVVCRYASAQAPGDAAAPALPPGLYAVFKTGMGTFTAKLYEKDAPGTVENFVALAQGTKAWRDPKTNTMVKRPRFDNITFHRVLPGQMIQSGDPSGTGSFPCGFTIRDEYLPGLKFSGAGRLAMANSGAPDSGGCQFFITADAIAQWDGKYPVFGQVVSGLDVVSKISHAPVRGDKPVEPVTLISVTIERFGPEPKPKKPRK